MYIQELTIRKRGDLPRPSGFKDAAKNLIDLARKTPGGVTVEQACYELNLSPSYIVRLFHLAPELDKPDNPDNPLSEIRVRGGTWEWPPGTKPGLYLVKNRDGGLFVWGARAKALGFEYDEDRGIWRKAPAPVPA